MLPAILNSCLVASSAGRTSPDSPGLLAHGHVPGLDQAHDSLDGFAVNLNPTKAICLFFHCLSLQDSMRDWERK